MREAQLRRVVNAATVLQSQIRRFNADVAFNIMAVENSASVKLQKNIRSYNAQREFFYLQQVVSLQTAIRAWNERSQFETLRFAMQQAQSRWRARAPRNKLKQLRIESRQLSNVLEKTKGLEDRILALQVL